MIFIHLNILQISAIWKKLRLCQIYMFRLKEYIKKLRLSQMTSNLIQNFNFKSLSLLLIEANHDDSVSQHSLIINLKVTIINMNLSQILVRILNFSFQKFPFDKQKLDVMKKKKLVRKCMAHYLGVWERSKSSYIR